MDDLEKLPKRIADKIIPDAESGCYIWWGALSPGEKGGYGYVGTGEEGSKVKRVHRFVWEKLVGPIPKGKCVLHKCDNRACANPRHLFIGTRRDNNRDMLLKGRNSRKLSEQKVSEIRRRFFIGGISKKQLSREYGVSSNAIRAVINFKSWRHV